MSVRKLENGRWEARERTGGRGSTRLARTFDRKGDAERWAAEMRRTRQLGGVPREDPDQTLAEFMEVFWEIHALPNLEAATRASYRNIWARHIMPRLGARELRSLTPRVISRFRVDLERSGVGVATVRKALAVLQSILAVAVVEERVDWNAASVVRKPRYERERRPHIFQPVEVERIRAQLPPLGAALVSVLAYSGPRPEEALRLKWRDVGAEALHFVDSKRHRERWTPLLGPLAGDLRNWRLASPPGAGPTSPVFPAHDGDHWQLDDWRNWRRRIWGAWITDPKTSVRAWEGVAPEGTRPRDLRSSFITVQVYAGRPLPEIARHVGTSVQMIDQHYFEEIAANWNGRPVAADTQIRRAREQLGLDRGAGGAR